MNEIRALNTYYAGRYFRSRLEARWAVVFDNLGLHWDYEPEGFDLPSGPYLPDFWLPEVRGGMWVEIKPDDPEINDDPRWGELAEASGRPVAILFGLYEHIFSDRRRRSDGNEILEPFDGPSEDGTSIGWDNLYEFCECACGTIGFEFTARSERIHYGKHQPERYGPEDRVEAAFRAGLSARFGGRQ